MASISATSRRAFIGAAGAGAVVAASSMGISSAEASTPSESIEGVVLSTTNASKGVFAVHVGERTLSVTDLEFASKIAKAIA